MPAGRVKRRVEGEQCARTVVLYMGGAACRRFSEEQNEVINAKKQAPRLVALGQAAAVAALVGAAFLFPIFGGRPAHPLSSPSAAATSVPSHVMSATQGDYNAPQPFPSDGMRWLTWALIGHNGSRAVQFHNAGVKVMYYTFETRQSTITEMWDTVQSLGDSAFAHDCAGHRLHSKQNTTYLLNVDSPEVQNAYRAHYIDGIVDRYPIDAVFYDGAGNLWDMIDEVTGEKAVPCVNGQPADPADWVSSHVAQAIAKIPTKVMFNGLAFWHTESDGPADQIALNHLPNVIGGRQEECFLGEGRPQGPHAWLAASNTALQMASIDNGKGKLMICQPKDQKNDPSSDIGISHRLFAYASFLLTYDLDNSIYWYAGPVHSNNLYPEIQVVAMNPVGGDVSSISQLHHGDGVYGREYKDCYMSGRRVGSCAVAANMDRQRSGSFPFSSYVGNSHAHVLALSGADIPSGGTATLGGSSAPSTLDPATGIIVFDTSR